MRQGILLLLLLVLAGLVIGVATRAPRPSELDRQPARATPSFVDEFEERLNSVQLAADALVDLGERRERNLLVVGQRQSAMNTALDATDAWLAQQAAAENEPPVAAYRAGAEKIRRAMSDAQSAFLHFDWSGVAAANDTLRQGAADIAAAKGFLESDAGG